MKKIKILFAIIITGAAFITGCDSNRQPGKVYMPDMGYSRAYESYAIRDSAKFTMNSDQKGGKTIFFNSMPVNGTVKRGELFPYVLPNDSIGYKMSAGVKNPIDSISKLQMAETKRLFNINCAICHGETGAGNGPIAAAGHIGGVANLTLPAYVSMADGTMFHSINYGKNLMGSYASQLTRAQRWMIVKYIRTLQPKAEAAPAAGAKATTDTTAKKI
jgi:mono/diheme cytochrome c family protein